MCKVRIRVACDLGKSATARRFNGFWGLADFSKRGKHPGQTPGGVVYSPGDGGQCGAMFRRRIVGKPASPVQPVPMTLADIFHTLAQAGVGAYAVSTDQTILFWNQGAERLLGFTSDEAVGHRCHELGSDGLTAECGQGCPMCRGFRTGAAPQQARMMMRCASGTHRPVSVTPLMVGGTANEGPALLYVLEQANGLGDAEQTREDIPAGATPLTNREIEVLRLVSQGGTTLGIAAELSLSHHTVLNHIRNTRRKLGARTRLDAVTAAMRLGILTVDDRR